jgi:endonuclease YncB( thermonuclease family)
MSHGRRAERSRVPRAAALALVAAVFGAVGPPVSAITAEAEQTWETAVVEHVSDGDTVRVRIVSATNPEMYAPAEGQTYCRDRVTPTGGLPEGGLRGCLVRLIAIQAAETEGHGSTDLPQCGAEQAKAALAKALPVGTVVQLRSINVGSGDPKYSGGRLARSVYAPDGAGGWVDVARALYRRGLVMWFPFNTGDTEKAEYSHNLEYRRLADAAAAAKLGLWSDNLCGPSSPVSLRMWVVSDPPGADDSAGETVVIVNDAATPVDLSGWTLRDSSLTWAQLPPGAVIAPSDYIYVHTGSGTAGAPTVRDFYMGRENHVFANFDATDNYFYGDAAYLYDVQPGHDYGNLRAWYHYPCDPDDCWDPLVAKLTLRTVQADPPGVDTAATEYVQIRNSTREAIPLGGYQLRWNDDSYVFSPTATIKGKGTLRVVMGTGKDRRAVVHAGLTHPALANPGGRVELMNLNASVVDCRAWGTGTCPTGVPQSSASRSTKSATRSRVAKVPTAPTSVTARLVGGQVEIRWMAPDWPGSAPIQIYRVRVYRWVTGRHVYTSSCTTGGPPFTCTTDKLTGTGGLFVRVTAKNKHGYGNPSTYIPVSQSQAAGQ